MTETDAGKYATKHPKGTKIDERIAKSIKAHLTNDKLSCKAASLISTEQGVSMADIGTTADLLDVRITKCLLGLFGLFSPTGEKLKPEPAEVVSKEVEDAINRALDDGRLSCKAVWETADQLGLTKKQITSCCQTLKIKIFHCQIGAF